MISAFTVIVWDFDFNLTEASGTYIAVGRNNIAFSSSSVHGRGAALVLSPSLLQGVEIVAPFLPLQNRSWTFEAWIYPTAFNSTDQAIIAQFEAGAIRKRLHLLIRNRRLHFGFRSDDFVFDCSTRNRSLFLDGQLEAQNISGGCYEGTNGNLTVGMERTLNIINYFEGLIDQVMYTSRAKTNEEIQRAAT
jgi:hypothetical protein